MSPQPPAPGRDRRHRGRASTGTARPLRAAARLLLTVLAVAGPSCDRPPEAPAVNTVVLLTIDTWRRDATGFLGGAVPTPTPFLDGLAESGLVAEQAVTPVPLTGPAHWSMLSGRWPWRDGVRVNGDRPRPGFEPPLPELLRREGWRTAGFVSCAVLDHRLGFAGGFDHFDDSLQVAGRVAELEMPERRGDLTVGAALDWVANREADERMFLWVHLFDPHFPYEAPPSDGSGPRDAYLAEVAFADRQSRRLAQGLGAMGRTARNSLWLVLADHGEGLGDHGAPTHGLILHGAATAIPLLVAGPGVPSERTARPASTVDILPTILDLLGLGAPGRDGESLVSRPRGPDREIPLESLFGLRSFGLSPVWGLRSGEWLWEASPASHLWAVAEDPGELRDLAGARSATVERLAARRRLYEKPDAAGSEPVAEELRRNLEALGYLGGSGTTGEGDVRQFVLTGAKWQFEAFSRRRQGDLEGAESLFLRFLDRYPNSPSVWSETAFLAVETGRLAEAESRFRRALELDPTTGARLNLANVLYLRGRPAAAEEAFRQVLAEDPEDLQALFNLGRLLEEQGRPSEAAVPWRRFVELYPEHPQAPAVRAKLQRPDRG